MSDPSTAIVQCPHQWADETSDYHVCHLPAGHVGLHECGEDPDCEATEIPQNEATEPANTWPDDSMLEAAWGIIANANGGNWDEATPEWREAAERWRDAYHRTLDSGSDGARP